MMTSPIARSQTREQQILALLTERRGERMTATAVASALGTEVENVRSALQRMHKRLAISRSQEMRTYRVGDAVCRHRAALWFMPLEDTEKPQEARSVSGCIHG